jgi:hypothetical protein
VDLVGHQQATPAEGAQVGDKRAGIVGRSFDDAVCLDDLLTGRR